MRFQLGGRARGPKAEINMTPLVDVVLVLLIIFVVVTPLLHQGIPVHLPSARDASRDRESSPLIVTIKADRTIYVGQTVVRRSELERAIERALADSPNRIVLLRGDEGLHWGDVRRPMQQIRAAQQHIHAASPGVSLAARNSGAAR